MKNASHWQKNQKDKKIIITIARLVEQKDHENLINAFKLLQKNMPETELWILGDGPRRKELETLVKKLELQNKVFLLGWVSDIKSYIDKSNLFVLSSKREGFSYVLLEAMCQGIPVISTDTPYGPGEILGSGEFGVLVPMGRPDRMQNAMLTLLKNKQKYKYYSEKSIERSKFFSANRMLNGYKSLISDLVE
jgi:glycosyltransferase involved in cell wall biosynthesis